MKLNISPSEEKVDTRKMSLSTPLFLVPLAILVFLLVRGNTPAYSIFWAFISVIGMSLIRKETRPSWRNWVEGCINGATSGA